MKPEVGIIIPFYNGNNVIGQCLNSIKASSYENVRVYLVDNSSVETQISQTTLSFSFVRVLKAPPSIGFGKACNIGAAAAASEGVRTMVFLNQDTILSTDCLMKLVLALEENGSIGIAVPINWSIDFLTIESWFVKTYIGQCPELVADAIRGSLRPLYFLESVMGSCMAIPAQVYRNLGLFDEMYFMYYEDVDLCRRYRKAGLRISLLSGAHVGHVNSQTATKDNLAIHRQMRNSSRQFHLKGTSKSFVRHSAGLLLEAALEYIRVLSSGQFGLFSVYLCDDAKLMFRLRKIYLARERERELIETQRLLHTSQTGSEAGCGGN